MATLTHLEWNQDTGGLEVAKAFADQIREKNVLITGVSPESIGSSIALSIASQAPALLILASRTESKLEQVRKAIQDAYPETTTKLVLLDLMSQDSVRKTAKEVAELTNRLDLIINNAGLMTKTRRTTAEGIEAQFGANHIGHFLLTNLLVPQLLKSAASSTPGATRVVNVSSQGHRLSGIRFSDYNLEKSNEELPEEERYTPPPLFAKIPSRNGYHGFAAYGQSKTANILFSIGINKKLGGKGIRSYALHPGAIPTNMSRDLDSNSEELEAVGKTMKLLKTLDQGAATVLVAALDPALNDEKGVFLDDCQIRDAAPHATDPDKAEKLWELSEKLVGTKFEL
ncbi:hypothetical protein COCMIDRAFT_80292 [Bipolaris oryzae ATCC 44560]|uniref:Ketoreductase (KR) domain-containing protein n=1 Tax=Bipolaris oryzae ATCC 44560 TaxID=930090 RepID=W7A4P7_COCMI|nr:uncharacterized protein COCMIDRAFT_80292 [Bipolaris oryzae ATCC 44560]EUC51131.1 hypothetical protein COCMIDRAFT_80292 [Bipolaris oryzae ATCC 44560]